jgi:TolB-like protein/Flp pilus assembly protein TadD
MASIIPGYQYDIFISYRQKDNKHDGWVTDFVGNLKGELESTFKEEVSVYFDINPDDGLLETHDVDASLKEKLKCLVFIPIISQTFCDSKSFAWQHEFCAFNKMAKEDQFGRDIRLSSGNIASRILPVKIYDLDPEDKDLLENELGGVLRCIEFIYKEAGVNRPLNHDDDAKENLNRTQYRNQVNKVANAVKEIISAIKKYNRQDEEAAKKSVEVKPESPKKKKPKIIMAASVALVLIVLGYFFIPGLFKPSESVEKSIAVLPFENMSDDKEHAWFGDAMTDEITTQLYKIKQFTVRSRTSVMQYKGSTKTSPVIAHELKVNYLIEGSAQRFADQVKIRVQLINASTDNHIWGETYDFNWKDILSVQSDVAKTIASELKTVLSPEENKLIDKKPTENPEAYNYYLIGTNYFMQGFYNQEWSQAIIMLEKAIELDPKFALAYARLAGCHLSQFWYLRDHSPERLEKSKKAIDEAFKIDPDMPEAHLALGTYYFWGFMNYSKALEEIKIAEKSLKNNFECVYQKGNIYRRAGEWSLAKENYLKAFELDPVSSRIAQDLAGTLYLMCEYQEAEKYFKQALLLNPAFIEAILNESLMYMKWKGNTIQSREIIAEASKFTELNYDPMIIELNVLMDIYEGNYQKAVAFLSSKNIDIIQNQFYINLKSLLYARLYNLMNMPEKAFGYYDSARVVLESRILINPDDPRLYSAIGIAYGGLGQKEKAIEAGKKAVELMPISKEAYRGVYRVGDLARICVMVGEYDMALDHIKQLLSLPGPLSAKLLLLDPAWKPLWDQPEFRKIEKNRL